MELKGGGGGGHSHMKGPGMLVVLLRRDIGMDFGFTKSAQGSTPMGLAVKVL